MDSSSGQNNPANNSMDDNQHESDSTPALAANSLPAREPSMQNPLGASLSDALSSGLKLPQLSPHTTERVFPVRSILESNSEWGSSSLPMLPSPEDPTSTLVDNHDKSMAEEAPNDNTSKAFNNESKGESSIMPEDSIPVNTSNDRPYDQGRDFPRVTRSSLPQLALLVPERSSLLDVNKTTSKLVEKDHVTFMLQSSGALLILQESQGKFVVRVASNTTTKVIGFSPKDLFELDCLSKIVRPGQWDKFLEHSRLVRHEGYDAQQHGPEVSTISLGSRDGKMTNFWCTMHTTTENIEYIICELEPDGGFMYKDQSTSDLNPNITMANDRPSTAVQHTEKPVGPFGALKTLRESGPDSDSTVALNAMSQVVQLISTARTFDVLFKRAIVIIKELTDFNHITAYRFDGDWNGISVAEMIDPKFSLGSDSNHQPVSAISEDCPNLHLHSKVSFCYSGQEVQGELLCRTPEDASMQPDLTHCYLIATKETSLKTVTGIPVHACLTIRINVLGKLWGAISCLSFDQSSRLSPLVQKLCWLISDTLSSNIERLSYELPFHIREQGADLGETKSMRVDEIRTEGILSLFGADFAAWSILGEAKIIGKPVDSQEVFALVEYIRTRDLDSIIWSTDITKDFADLTYPPGFKYVSGLLCIPLSSDHRDFIAFFKSPQSKEDTSLRGDEHIATALQDSIPFASPNRTSASTQSNVWSAADLGKASIFSLIYSTFSEVWQKKEVAMQNTQLMKLLLANCAHEVRTPLNAIINYLEIALDGTLEQETRDNLSRSHSASKSLIYIINDLLDLANAENGNSLIKDETFNLSETIHEAASIFREETKQKHVELHVVQHSSLPLVQGDQRRVRQVITNLISNAIQHTSSGAVTVEVCAILEQPESERVGVDLAVHDTGCGMSQEKVEILFYELEQVSNEECLPSLKGTQSENGAKGDSKSVLGLGLALVARIVHNMDGQLSVKSEPGQGSCFRIRVILLLASGQILSSNVEELPCPRSTTCEGATNSAPSSEQQAISESLNSHISQMSLSKEPSCSASYIDAIPTPSKPPKKLHILVAEDDPINSKIVKKRLETLGYTVHVTGNGKECAAAHCKKEGAFDAVLMDIQMPIADGISSTKTIREFERLSSSIAGNECGSRRIPIFAVSASILEKDRQSYIDTGFDGWVMKPIDFHRVTHLLSGIHQDELRNESVYKPGMWEKRGWFEKVEDTASESIRTPVDSN